ncbi:FAD-dependent oxidoreductase [Variovorax sp. VRV01]|uniref:NAD(P)/FAD-dependent oxidoreductase n=1 Tax=Variovorax sp. VRV01 TaxID=2769259 RepID=UPI00177B2CD3|nr:FAD-dependent oxidoreductase [Variovorax sp. VRV01]MBD9667098.1 FAD-dependent oxidoreductase [Variovorax sp. VRV01]
MAPTSSRPTVAVVGGGIVGLSTALQLQLDGHDVTVIERDAPMQACSAGNAGYLSEANIFPPASPDMLWQMPRLMLAKDGPLVVRPSYALHMLPWGRRALTVLKPEAMARITGTLAAMTRMAYASISGLAAQAGASNLISRDGGLIAFKTQPALDKKCAALDTWNRHDLPVRRLSAVEIAALEPALAPDIVGGLLFQNSGRCSNPQGLGLRYAEHLAAQGGRVVRDEVGAVSLQEGGKVTVQGQHRSRQYDRIVVCGGYWSGALMRPFFRHVPLASERGYHLMLPRPGLSLTRPVVFGEPHFAATPMDEGLRLAGTAEFARWDAPPAWERAHMLLALARQYLRGLDGDEAKPWMGVRPSLPDGLPAIGTVPSAPAIHYAFGHAHNGLTLSAVTARCISALVQGTAPPVDLAPLSLERFS